MGTELPHGVDEQIDIIRLGQQRSVRLIAGQLIDHLRPKRNVWEEAGQVKWRHTTGEITSFIPQDPDDLNQIKTLLAEYDREERKKGGPDKTKQEEIEMELQPLIKIN